jgi:hypothetical protein
MKHTDPLEIVVQRNFEKMKMAIHPNDGEDLSLYMREHDMVLYAGQSIAKFKEGKGELGKGELHLLNECRIGTLMISGYLSSHMNHCDKAILIRDNEKLFVTFRL